MHSHTALAEVESTKPADSEPTDNKQELVLISF